MTTTPPVARSIEVEASPDEVWELLTDDDERATWFGGATTLDPEPGGVGDFTEPDGTRRSALVDDVVPGRRLAWTWWADDDPEADRSHVDVELTPTPGGTRISVTETPIVPTAQASIMTASTGPLLDLEFRILCRVRAHVTTRRW